MIPSRRFVALLTCLLIPLSVQGQLQDAGKAIPPIERKLPATGKPLAEEHQASLMPRLEALEQALPTVDRHPLAADAGALIKAVRLAFELQEFYKPDDHKKVDRVLTEAERRIKTLRNGVPDWTTSGGLVVRGFRSRIDGSFQPYGMAIPEGWPASLGTGKSGAIVWLHGRGDSETDLHFIDARMRSQGQVKSNQLPIIHVFGRHCLGFKSAGETDVLEALDHALTQYPIDRQRVVLMGFSMGGAGAWHLGAHYVDRWIAVSPGAGFAETARYQGLKPDQFPPSYEQTLWSIYDVPNYVRNLFNVPVIAYSGEKDKQIQAARVMEEAFEQQGRRLDHRIGPGMAHQYHPDVLAQMVAELESTASAGRSAPRELHLQTKTLRYATVGWLRAERLEGHYRETRIDADMYHEGWNIATRNVTLLRANPPPLAAGRRTLTIDADRLEIDPSGPVLFERIKNHWTVRKEEPSGLFKRPGLQGPIDDAFLEPFIVVTPSAPCMSNETERWVNFELQHLRQRWRAVFRGELPEVVDDQVTERMLKEKHLVLFGDAASNRIIRRILSEDGSHRLPLVWDEEQLVLAGRKLDPKKGVPLCIYPNPLAPERYVVLNSGPTFREAHDRTNSLQNPKLPDWALVSFDELPSDRQAGRIVDAGFFDESWSP